MHTIIVPVSLALACGAAWAQATPPAQAPADYPSKPIRFIMISAAGSGGDALGRLLAERMAPQLKATFVVENRPGAGGALATDAAAKAAPDGYTIAIGGATTHVLLPASNPRLPYHATRDFAPLGRIGTAAIVLMATPDFPANNAGELLGLARGKAGAVQYASWGLGSTGHFCGELFNLKAQGGLSHIPYKSVAQILTDMLGGHVKLGWVDSASAMPMVKSGRLKALVTCPGRSVSLPQVASFDDESIDFSGMRTGELGWALYAPAGTPRPILDKLSQALRGALEQPEVQARLLEMGIQPAFVPGPEFNDMTARAIELWRQVAKVAKITVE